MHKNVEAVAQATADLYRELEQEWHDLDRMREEALAKADGMRLRQDEIEQRVRGCYDTAALFGFDLQTILMSDRELPRTAMEMALPPAVPKKIPTVKEFVLDAARIASPKRVRASELRKAILDLFGLELHEKTVGMTLYRLMKEGWVTRQGADWFYNQNHGVTAANVYGPPGSEDAPPDDEWLHQVAG